MIYIYALQDPFTLELKYVGKTIRLHERLMNQCNENSNTHRCHWIQSIVKRGAKPIHVILETLEDGAEWEDRERYWIAYGRAQGWPLTNGTEGGDGVKGLTGDSLFRMQNTWVGRKHKPESGLKIAAANRRRIVSDQQKQRASDSLKDRIFTKLHRKRLSRAIAKLTDDQVRDVRRRLDARESQYKIAADLNVHQGTISNIKRKICYRHVK